MKGVAVCMAMGLWAIASAASAAEAPNFEFRGHKIGEDMRAAFPGGETLSLAKPGPAIALVPARRDLPLRYARLRRNIQAAFGTQIRMTPLPGRLTEALRLVDELAG